jgi:hypothetical protein
MSTRVLGKPHALSPCKALNEEGQYGGTGNKRS